MADVMAALSDPEPRTRMQGIVALSKRADITVDALVRLGGLLDDDGEYDPNPGTTLGPKWVPTVKSCAEFYLPYIAAAGPEAVQSLVAAVPTMDPGDRALASRIVCSIGLPAVAKLAVLLGEDQLRELSAVLLTQPLPGLDRLVDAFRSTPAERPRRVINCLGSLGQETLAGLPEVFASTGSKAIPYLGEIARYNAEHPHTRRFASWLGLDAVLKHRTVRYNTALKAISMLAGLGSEARPALVDASRSRVDKIRKASEKALSRLH